RHFRRGRRLVGRPRLAKPHPLRRAAAGPRAARVVALSGSIDLCAGYVVRSVRTLQPDDVPGTVGRRTPRPGGPQSMDRAADVLRVKPVAATVDRQDVARRVTVGFDFLAQ